MRIQKSKDKALPDVDSGVVSGVAFQNSRGAFDDAQVCRKHGNHGATCKTSRASVGKIRTKSERHSQPPKNVFIFLLRVVFLNSQNKQTGNMHSLVFTLAHTQACAHSLPLLHSGFSPSNILATTNDKFHHSKNKCACREAAICFVCRTWQVKAASTNGWTIWFGAACHNEFVLYK